MTSPDTPPEIEIEPISFRSGRPPGRSRLSRTFIWFFGSVVVLFFLCLAGTAWFVFTAKQVVIGIDPEPDRMSLDGGIITPRLGDHYLLRPGEYRLRAMKQGYQPFDKDIRVTHEKSQVFNIMMEKLPGKISFSIHQEKRPDIVITGAVVHIDGQKIGETPIKEMPVTAGQRDIRIYAENYQEFNTQAMIKGMGETQVFDFGLLPGWADVTIRAVPEADIRVDGHLKGKTPLQFRLPEGIYELKLSAKRFKPLKMRLSITANQPKLLDMIRLEPEDGLLEIYTQPNGANVTISGKFIGQTPLKIPLAPNISHTVSMSKAGYENAMRKITVASAEKRQINLKLTPQKGVIHFRVTPPEAVLFIDGTRYGTVPEKIELVATAHDLEIRKKGYEPYVVHITPRPGFPQQVAVVLSPITSDKKSLPEVIKTVNGYTLKRIHPTPFTMGSSRREQGRRSNESLRKIILKRPFYVGIREVTNKAFKAYLSTHDSGEFKTHSLNRSDQPVVRVTWKQAALFCNWLSKKQGLPPVYTINGDGITVTDPLKTGYRLPTEAEWEYCARFTENAGYQKYPWGTGFPPPDRTINIADISAKDLLPARLDIYDDGYAAAAPPGKFKANMLGLYDLGGNVSEWCHDFYTIYPYSSNKVYTDPTGPTEGKHHVVRGSSWQHASISVLRAAYRDYSNSTRSDLGFRVARYVK